eukprot:scaffold10785_cov114-Isochrysis_galbana.AAC.2
MSPLSRLNMHGIICDDECPCQRRVARRAVFCLEATGKGKRRPHHTLWYKRHVNCVRFLKNMGPCRALVRICVIPQYVDTYSVSASSMTKRSRSSRAASAAST